VDFLGCWGLFLPTCVAFFRQIPAAICRTKRSGTGFVQARSHSGLPLAKQVELKGRRRVEEDVVDVVKLSVQY
jgi:hypothetical protein